MLPSNIFGEDLKFLPVRSSPYVRAVISRHIDSASSSKDMQSQLPPGFSLCFYFSRA